MFRGVYIHIYNVVLLTSLDVSDNTDELNIIESRLERNGILSAARLQWPLTQVDFRREHPPDQAAGQTQRVRVHLKEMGQGWPRDLSTGRLTIIGTTINSVMHDGAQEDTQTS